MGVEELLDDNAFNPEKLFNEKEYSTIVINRDGFTKKENTVADLIESLLDKNLSREESESIFTKLKEAKAQHLLVNAIRASKHNSQKTVLTAACWECGLDFSEFFLDFVELVLQDDFQLALEALSVIESTDEQPAVEVLKEALLKAESKKVNHPDLVQDLISNIKLRIS